MTPMEGLLLLLGLFGVPVGLLALSHRFRDRGRRARGAFWGGLGGYVFGLSVWVWTLLGPAVMWNPGSTRLAGVILPLLGVAVFGAIVGAAIGRTPRRGPRAPGRQGRATSAGSTGSTAVILGLLVAGTSAAADPAAGQVAGGIGSPDDLFVVRDIDTNVIIAETAPGVSSSAYASSVAVLGSRGVLLIDTFHGPGPAEWFLDRIAERTDVPVRWVVNTHWHGDHLWGNAAVLDRFPEVDILAHPATLERIASEGATALEAELDRLDARIESLEQQIAALPADDERLERGRTLLGRARAQRVEAGRIRIAPPTVPVSDFRRLDVGNRTVWIQPVGPAHTDGDVVVWIDGILVAGDIVEEGTLWLDGADVRAWASTLGDLAGRGPGLVIPSHGGLPETADRAALLHLHRDALQAAVAHGSRTNAAGAAVELDLSAFADLRARFSEWGVGGEAFDAWMVRAVEAVRESAGGGSTYERP